MEKRAWRALGAFTISFVVSLTGLPVKSEAATKSAKVTLTKKQLAALKTGLSEKGLCFKKGSTGSRAELSSQLPGLEIMVLSAVVDCGSQKPESYVSIFSSAGKYVTGRVLPNLRGETSVVLGLVTFPSLKYGPNDQVGSPTVPGVISLQLLDEGGSFSLVDIRRELEPPLAPLATDLLSSSQAPISSPSTTTLPSGTPPTAIPPSAPAASTQIVIGSIRFTSPATLVAETRKTQSTSGPVEVLSWTNEEDTFNLGAVPVPLPAEAEAALLRITLAGIVASADATIRTQSSEKFLGFTSLSFVLDAGEETIFGRFIYESKSQKFIQLAGLVRKRNAEAPPPLFTEIEKSAVLI